MKDEFMITKRIVLCIAVAVSLTACQQMQDNPKETIGTLLGAGAGALLGTQIGGGKGSLIASAVGGLGGGWLGKEIGKSLDNADRAMMDSNSQYSLEKSVSGTSSSWSNPKSGNSGTFTPTRTYVSTAEQNCREYETTIIVDGRPETATGTACRNSDGKWSVTNS